MYIANVDQMFGYKRPRILMRCHIRIHQERSMLVRNVRGWTKNITGAKLGFEVPAIMVKRSNEVNDLMFKMMRSTKRSWNYFGNVKRDLRNQLFEKSDNFGMHLLSNTYFSRLIRNLCRHIYNRTNKRMGQEYPLPLSMIRF